MSLPSPEQLEAAGYLRLSSQGDDGAETARLRTIAAGGARTVRQAIDEAVAAERERIVRWLERRGGRMAPGPDREALLGAAEALEDRSDEKEPGHA